MLYLNSRFVSPTYYIAHLVREMRRSALLLFCCQEEEVSGELSDLFLPMITFSAMAIFEAESSVVIDMLLMLVVLKRLQLVEGYLAVDNWNCRVLSRLVG